MGKREALQALAPRLRLPALPQVVARIGAMLADRQRGPKEIGQALGEDPGLAARALSIANSSRYGLEEPVVSTEQAATVIGVRDLRNLVLQASIARRYEHLSGGGPFDLDAAWAHAMLTARLAQMLGTAQRRETQLAPDEFYTCGLLHDLGKIVLLDSLGDDYAGVLGRARAEGRPVHLVEVQELGFTHVDVGALVAQRWKLPQDVALAIAFHHGPLERVLAHPAVAAVAIADQLAYRGRSGASEVEGQLADVAARALDVTPQAYERVLAAAREADGRERAA
jgi:putative nucleotidyltransferase with HDIG domain